MAEQKGAPVNQKEPPTTAMLPFSPGIVRYLSEGKACLIRLSKAFVMLLCILIYKCNQFRYYRIYYQRLTKMEEVTEYRAAYFHIKTENQILQDKLEEAEFRLSSVKREVDIMHQLNQDQNQQINYQKQEIMKEEIQKLKTQLVTCIAQKEQLEILNSNYLQKINDLKYNNGQLKNLNQKLTQLHSREISMIKREAMVCDKESGSDERERKLQKEKEALQKKLESCGQIAKQMENYYLIQIKKKTDLLKGREEDIRNLTRELEGTRTQRTYQKDAALKQCIDKYDNRIESIKEGYQNQINQLKGKVKFLIGKIESLQEEPVSKVSLGKMSSEPMVQSKMLQSNSSIDSCRVTTPNSSIATNRDYPTRRNTSGMKTPNKYIQGRIGMTKNNCPLADKTNH